MFSIRRELTRDHMKLLPALDRVQKAKVLKAHLRLSRKSGLLPSSFYMHNVMHMERIIETPSVDIYRGEHQGGAVCLKKYRFCAGGLDRDYISEVLGKLYLLLFFYSSTDALIQLLQREAIIWANHQFVGVLRFIGVYQCDDGPFDHGLYLVSPFLEHGTINQYLSSNPHANRCLLVGSLYFP